MLRFLSIENLTLIERLELDFSEGLNLITGETGSGKSILVDAVGLLVGERASSDLIRTSSQRARVEGIFTLGPSHPARPLLESAGIETGSEELIIRREISRTGANKVFLNGSLSTQSLLAEVGALLADIHGQHDQQTLLQPASHIHFLDRFGDYSELREEVAASARRLQQVSREVQAIQARERERLLQLDQLRYQMSDIDKLKLKAGLDQQLEQERRLLATSEKRQQTSRQAYQLIYEDEPSVLALLDRASRLTEELSQLDEDFQASVARLSEARFNLEEVAFELRGYADNIEFDPARLEAINGQLAEIQLARKKYGDSVDAILEFREHCHAGIEELSAEENRLEVLESQLGALENHYLELAGALSDQRRKAARRLSLRVEQELADLAMEKTVFKLEFTAIKGSFSELGNEQLEFLISPNPGEPPRALVKIASGGELSRILLALKSILNPDRHSKTLVFDEVDAGIGGRVASVLAEKLARLAREHQVFCVTHLPQIAAAAARHFHVGKEQSGKHTRIRLQLLDRPQREQEVARMLAGKEVTATTLRQAGEMLRNRERDQNEDESLPARSLSE